ncbi:S-adenosyl-L-methionine-dependent methyltransferase [Lasiosphaeria miniovina]|uniref:S-adenosyl-L-methionine-dependent methyltransferase n=1 Tax=Lasiosphaeria miniovina TaxID=1954250 RepID=A0AA39ZZM3_9PEZI|nr:S-adenosyl-L-methionine-dependent methyltransferase [Lasiosphaeria miniovina]KAK0706314.1 S-adenosyl-L-methionine-dependent methyltransferase [Lasiosphaeria miniovina]
MELPTPETSVPETSVPENVKERLAASYDAIAASYNAWTAQHSGLRLHYVEKLLQLLPPLPSVNDSSPSSCSGSGGSGGGNPTAASDSAPVPMTHLVELGCGAGFPVTQALLEFPDTPAGRGRRVHVTANDLSATQVALGREGVLPRAGSHDQIEWVAGDMMHLSFAAGSLDAVVALYSLIHLPREEQVVLLERVARWLKPGGLVLANFSVEDTPGEVMDRWLGEEKGWMYWSGFGVDKTLEVVTRKAGLEVVLSEVSKNEDGVDAEFLWVIARAPESLDL